MFKMYSHALGKYGLVLCGKSKDAPIAIVPKDKADCPDCVAIRDKE